RLEFHCPENAPQAAEQQYFERHKRAVVFFDLAFSIDNQ
ncbi:MAG: hypothetical protein RLZZ628_932, partial [Bacteroidota bacterium]